MNTSTHMPDAMIEQLKAQDAARARQIDALWEMTPQERIAAMYRNELTTTQLLAWAARHPEEVPLIDGEFAFIAVHTPEVADLTR